MCPSLIRCGTPDRGCYRAQDRVEPGPMPGFKLQPVGEGFFETAPWRFVETFEIPRPAHEIWRELIADGALSFCRSLRGAKDRSASPGSWSGAGEGGRPGDHLSFAKVHARALLASRHRPD
jgi:hypothetical protein